MLPPVNVPLKISLKIAGLLLLATVACAEPDAQAQAAVAGTPPGVREPEKNWRLGVALGFGERTNPLIQSDDIPVIVDLDIAWFGERWFFDNFDLGFALVDNSRFTTNVVARLNSDRAFFGKTNTRYVNFTVTAGGGQVPIPPPASQGAVDAPVVLKVPDRDYAVELGLEMLLDGEWGHATLRAFHDV